MEAERVSSELDFYYEDVDVLQLIENGIGEIAPTEIAGNLSDGLGELAGSSVGSNKPPSMNRDNSNQNLAASTSANGEISGNPLENYPNFAQSGDYQLLDNENLVQGTLDTCIVNAPNLPLITVPLIDEAPTQAHLLEMGTGLIDGRSSWSYQEQLSTFQNASYFTSSELQHNQFMAEDVYGPENAISMEDFTPFSSRPTQSTNWVQQVSEMLSSYDQIYHHSMPAGLSVYSRIQIFSYQYNEVSFGPTSGNPQGWNTMSPGSSSMPSRLQQFNGFHQNFNSVDLIQTPSDLQNLTPNHFLPENQSQLHMNNAGSSVLLNRYEEIDEASTAMSYIVDHPSDDSSSRAQAGEEQQELQSNNGSMNLSHDDYNQNSQEILVEEEGIRGKRSRTNTPTHSGDSSSSFSKRVKKESTETHEGLAACNPHGASGSQKNEEIPSVSKLSDARVIKNGLYDPSFEEIGLPVDPHLRMFANFTD